MLFTIITHKFDMPNSTKEQVESFLNYLHTKLNIFSIVFDQRDKNRQTLADLEISYNQRIDFIKSMKPEDYIDGPNKDTNDTTRPDYWVFGIKVKEKDIYVKINLGYSNKPVICISFHIAEFPLEFPFK